MKYRKNILKAIPIIIICIWCVLIFSLSAMNSSSSNGTSTRIIKDFLESTYSIINRNANSTITPNEKDFEMAAFLFNVPLRKFMHASVYFILSILIIYFVNKNWHKKYLFSLLITILICFTFACLDEYHQTFVNGRTGKFSDVIVDSVGALTGTLIFGTYYITFNKGVKFVQSKKTNHKKKEKNNKDIK